MDSKRLDTLYIQIDHYLIMWVDFPIAVDKDAVDNTQSSRRQSFDWKFCQFYLRKLAFYEE